MCDPWLQLNITDATFPFTREGHRKLLAKANALKRANKRTWSMFFEQLEAAQELPELANSR